MKHKLSKRSSSNKQSYPRSNPTQTKRLLSPIDHIRPTTPIDLVQESSYSDEQTTCLRPNIPLKNQKLLKRELLRCSNQRPPLANPQLLQAPHNRRVLQQTHSVTLPSTSTSSSSSSSPEHRSARRRRSLSFSSLTLNSTTDRIGPWPDASTSSPFRLDGNDPLRPIKNFRKIRHSRPFSPKGYTSLSDNTYQFKVYTSRRSYIEEYRKNKGYILTTNSLTIQRMSSLLSSSSIQSQESDDDQLSVMGTYSGGAGHNTNVEKTCISGTNISSTTRTVSKSVDDISNSLHKFPLVPSTINQANMLPAMPIRSGNQFRANRRAHHQSTLTLPTLVNPSLQYVNSLNPVEKFNNFNKKTSTQNPSKLFLINGRPTKRHSPRSNTDTKATPVTQNHVELRTTGSSIITKIERTESVVVYRLPRRTRFATSHSDVGPLSTNWSRRSMDPSKTNLLSSTSISDGPLAPTLTSKLSIGANTSLQSANSHSHYKSSPNACRDVEEQEQLSPLGAWGFLPSPSENDESSSQVSHDQTQSSSLLDSPENLSNQNKMEDLLPHDTSNNHLLCDNTNDKADEIQDSPGSSTDREEVYDKPRIIIKKLKFDDPNLFPAHLTPDLVKKLSQENGQRQLRQRRPNNNNNNGAPPVNPSPKRKRQQQTADDESDYNFDEDEEDAYDDTDEYQTLRKRIRRARSTKENNSYDAIGVFKKKTRARLAHKALDIDANPEENASYKQFVKLLNTFDDDYERHRDEMNGDDNEQYLDILLSESTMNEMAMLSEKLKLSTYMSRVDIIKLKRLLDTLALRIKQGIELNPLLRHDANDEHEETEKDEQEWRSVVFERLNMCANASETALNIMTTPNMSKDILVENVIEYTALFIKSQLTKTIFPEYDPLYRSDNQANDPLLTKQKRSKATGTKCKQVQMLYNKIVSLFQGIADLMPLGKFTDTIILAISSFTVACIYVENIFDLQAHAINILPELFSRYEFHRDSILDDLLLSIVRLPTSKKSLRCYRLPSGESIQMFTALIMHLIHSPISTVNSNVADAANELNILNTYALGQNFAFKFLTLFFRSCGTKQGEDDYRIVFENFLADLLLTANRPEWPSSEILLTFLSRILMKNFSNQTVPMPTRLQSLEYLGSVAAQLRKDSVELDVLSSRENQIRLDRVVDKTLLSLELDHDVLEAYRTDPLRYHRSLIIYLNELSQGEPTGHFAKMFHIGQWLRDINLAIERLTQTLTKRAKAPNPVESIDADMYESVNNIQRNPTMTVTDEIELKKNEKLNILKMLSLSSTMRKQQRYPLDIEYDDICLLMRYLTSNRPFLKTFDVYLKQLAAVFQSESGTNIRSKAMKCLCVVVEADPTILGRNDIKSCVKVGLTDKSVSVREAAIDLIGRYIVHKQVLILQYYDVLCERSIDTGVSVRKRVVKIFRDICLNQADFVRLPDICSRLLRRIHDEESVRKIVLETFQQIWFSPTNNQHAIRQRVQIIIDVLIDAQKQNNTWLENLVKDLLQTNEKQSADDKAKIREQRKDILKAIQNIINELVESILKIESANDQISSNKMVATFIALYALGKAKPEHVLPHVSTIVEYLNIKCTSYNDNVIVQYVAKILEFTVPLMKSAASSTVYSLEGSLVKLLLVSGQLVIHSSIACLSAAVRLSKNVSLVKDVFLRYHSFIIQCQLKIIERPNEELKGNAQLARSIYILGVLCKYFDIEKPEYEDLQFTVEDVFQLLMFFIEQRDSAIKLKALVGLGFFLQRYGQYLVEDTVRKLYHSYLMDRRPSGAQLRCQVLINLEDYFRDCIRRMAEQDVEYLNIPPTTNANIDEATDEAHGITGANLKETADVHSEMASSIAQCYLRVVLDTYLSEDEIIRQCVRKVVTCILEQGLVHPIQFIPYLIAMTTDRDTNIQQSAEQNLQDLDKTNPGIIQTKVMQGFKMSYQLQKLLYTQNQRSTNRQQQTDPQSDIIRGMTKLSVVSMTNIQLPFCSVNHFLYSLIRSARVYRRALITQLLKMFDNESNGTTLTLEEQLFVADNLAYFPYQVQDEPLFIVEQIDLLLSVIGSTQLQHFRELLKVHLSYTDDEEGVDMNRIEKTLYDVPDEVIEELKQALCPTKPTMLLLLLKSYLKDVYYLNDAKIIEYDHSESCKITDRPIATRKVNVKFEPKIVLDTIKPIQNYDNFEKRRQIIKEFAEFKRHLLAYDNDIEETLQSMTQLLPGSSISTAKGKKRAGGSGRRRKVMIDSDDDSADDNNWP